MARRGKNRTGAVTTIGSPAKPGDIEAGRDLTIIVPTYNESGNVGPLLRDIRRAAPLASILIVDDDSIDGTQGIVQEFCAKDPKVTILARTGHPRGLTASVLDGLAQCRTRWFAVMDADLQHPPKLLPAILEQLCDGADALVAVRENLRGLLGPRMLVSLGGNAVAQITLALTRQRVIRDPMSGFFAGVTATFLAAVADRRSFEESGYKVLYDFLLRLPHNAKIAYLRYRQEKRKNGDSKFDSEQVLHVVRQSGRLGRLIATLLTNLPSPRFVRFLFVGGFGILVNLASLFSLAQFAQLNYLLSAALAIEASILWNFLWNERWTWKDRRFGSLGKRLARFHQVSLVGLLLNLVILYGLTTLAGLYYLASEIGGIAAASVWNFLANHYWTWAERPAFDAVEMFRRHRRSWYVIAFLVQVVLAGLFMHDWDGFVIEQSLQLFLRTGTGPYQVALQAPPWIYLGFNTPPVNTWYAYPPLPLLLLSPGFAAYLYSGIVSPVLGRMAWKLPIVLGNLLIPGVVARYLRLRGVQESEAMAAEAFLVLNPFLIFIGAVWGMFDVWIMVFLVASLSELQRDRPYNAGFLFALSALVKPFPLFLLPALLATIRRKGVGPRFAGGFLLASIAVVGPFLGQWNGLLYQALELHLIRPPQGFTVLGLFPLINAIPNVVSMSYDLSLTHAIDDIASFVSLGSLFVALLGAYLLASRSRSSSTVVPMMAISLFAVLVFSKVVNEQYFVMPLIFLVLLAFDPAPGILSASRARWAARWITLPGTVAAAVFGFHFLTFIPPDIAVPLFGKDTGQLVTNLQLASGIPGSIFYNLPNLVASALFAPMLFVLALAAARGIGRGLMGSFPQAAEPPPLPMHRRTRRGATIALISLALVVAVTGPFLLPPRIQGVAGSNPVSQSRGPWVGTFYYTWWDNPSHNPGIRYGSWALASETPVDGYYDMNARYVQLDLQQMRAAGIDFVVVSYDGTGAAVLEAVTSLALAEDVRVTMMWELSILQNDPRNMPTLPDGSLMSVGGLALRADTLARTVQFLSSLPQTVLESPAWFTLKGRHVMFLYDAFVSAPGFSPSEREFLVDALFRESTPQDIAEHLGATSVNANSLLQSYPSSLGDFMAQTQVGAFWRWAYSEAYSYFWRSVIAQVDARIGDVAWIAGQSWYSPWPFYRNDSVAQAGLSVFDGSFVYTPATSLWLGNDPSRPYAAGAPAWETWQASLAEMTAWDRNVGQPVIATVMPAYDDLVLRPEGFAIPADQGATYNRTWSVALAVDPDIVLVTSWNEDFEGTAIQPTQDFGNLFLTLTARWAQTLRSTFNANAAVLA